MTARPLIQQAAEAKLVAERCARSSRVAVDVEANGMHAYTPRLCTLQLAWDDETALIDTLAVDARLFEPLLGAGGPPKVLHDLTFDARMLGELGITLDNVRDTSVTARFLGKSETGLSALCQAHLGVTLAKGFQQHDWSRRPITAEQIDYLAGDVLHLLALDDALTAEAAAAGILDEVAVECGYKLDGARTPAPDPRPRHTRVKGHQALDERQLAALYWLVEAREDIARRRGVPPFRVAPNGLLLELARRRPRRTSEARRLCGRNHGAARCAADWLAAVERARIEPAPLPPEPPAPPPGGPAERRRLHGALSRWRRDEAERRGVDLQVVLPGHCFDPVIDALTGAREPAELCAQLASVPGFGACRVERYAHALHELRSPD